MTHASKHTDGPLIKVDLYGSDISMMAKNQIDFEVIDTVADLLTQMPVRELIEKLKQLKDA